MILMVRSRACLVSLAVNAAAQRNRESAENKYKDDLQINRVEKGEQSMDLFTSEKNIVHIRIQQRNGRKCITLVQGIADDLDLHKILKYLKKVYSTNGNIRSDPTYGEIIQLQGDQRKNVYDSLIEWQISPKEDIKVHGS